jgi:hypothetical protein
MGRSEERAAQDKGAQGRWLLGECGVGGLTATRRCETCDGRASRKIFLREIGESYRESTRLVGPALPEKRRPIGQNPDRYRLLGVCMFNPSIVFWRLCNDYVVDGVYFARTL